MTTLLFALSNKKIIEIIGGTKSTTHYEIRIGI